MSEESHFYDEKRKIFISKSNICTSCGGNAERASLYVAEVYNTTSRFTIVVASSVSFQMLKIGIPRCRKCYDIHQQANLFEKLLFLFIGFCSVFITIAICRGKMDDGAYILFIIPLCVMIGLFATIAGGIYLAKEYVKHQGAINETDLKMEDPFVRYLVREGWDLHKPSAR
jgi:hypothetical protein